MKTAINYENILIPVHNVELKGRLRIANNQKGLVIFSHGSGSGRLSAAVEVVFALVGSGFLLAHGGQSAGGLFLVKLLRRHGGNNLWCNGELLLLFFFFVALRSGEEPIL